MRLICFPYAGATRHVFARWSDSLPAWLDIRALQLPGRGTRVRETPVRGFDDLLDALMPQIAALLDLPVALFGHSVGAIVAFEIARRMARKGAPPAHLVVSGCRAPQSAGFDLPPRDASDDDLVADLRQLNGTPPELLEAPHLMEMFLQPLRADYDLLRSYVFVPGPPLTCPVTLFMGEDDDRENGEGRWEGWRTLAAGPWEAVTFPGDHFFPRSAAPALLAYLAQSFTRCASRSQSTSS
jgi:medium-chain acyl-[acyl-carrier-protein] hydrolase